MENSAPASTSAPSAAPSAPSVSAPTPSTGSESAPAAPASTGAPTPDFDFNQHLDKPVKLKVNGVDKELPLSKVLQDYQKAEAANEKFNKASELEKMLASKEVLFKQDPRKALQEFGHDPLLFAQQMLEDYLKEQEMSPEQKELNELRKFKEEQEKTKTEQEESKKQMEFQAAVDARKAELETNVLEAMDKVGLWKDVSTAQKMAEYMLEALDAGMDLTPEMAARLVKQDMQTSSKAMYGNLTGQQLFEILGEEGIKKVKEFDIGRVKTPSSATKSEAKPVSNTSVEGMENMSLSEYNRKLRQKLGL